MLYEICILQSDFLLLWFSSVEMALKINLQNQTEIIKSLNHFAIYKL